MSAEDIDPMEETEAEQDEWAERIPCPDESCIGTLGSDGRCRICGQQGEIPPAASNFSKDDPAIEDVETMPEPPGVEAEAAAAEYRDEEDDGDEPPAMEAWDDRRLCPDESCIGTLGSDGRCRICGRQGEGD